MNEHTITTAVVDRVVKIVGDKYREALTETAEAYVRDVPDVDSEALTRHLDDAMLVIIRQMIEGPIQLVCLNLRRAKWSWKRIEGITPDLEQQATCAILVDSIRDANGIYKALRRYVYPDLRNNAPLPEDIEERPEPPEPPHVRKLRTILEGIVDNQRQTDILAMLRLGYKQEEIAEKLGVSTRTIQRELQSIRERGNDELNKLSP